MTLTSSQRARFSPRADRKSKTPVPESVTTTKKEEEDRALRSGSEEGEIEED
jgi:pre-mRNA-processing factor 40